MIDLETLGTTAACPVISIGAVFFDQTGIKHKYYEILDVEQQIDQGRQVDGATIKWWMSQANAAKTVFNENARDSKLILEKFVDFINMYSNKKAVKPWGNGSNFDITILDDLFSFYGMDTPWEFWNIRDLRTFKEYVFDGGNVKRLGTHHNALDDAIYQAEIVIEGMKRTR